jgi:transmembrane sensor
MKKISDMRPNQHLEYDTLSGDISLSDEDIYRYIAWKDGKLVFRNEKLSDVLQKIGYFYNVDVELRGEELKEYRYRATFEEETFGEIMKLLKLSSPIDYYEVKREPLSDGSFPKKKIVIFPKDRK